VNVTAKVMADIPMNVCLEWHRTVLLPQLVLLFGCLLLTQKLLFIIYLCTL